MIDLLHYHYISLCLFVPFLARQTMAISAYQTNVAHYVEVQERPAKEGVTIENTSWSFQPPLATRMFVLDRTLPVHDLLGEDPSARIQKVPNPDTNSY